MRDDDLYVAAVSGTVEFTLGEADYNVTADQLHALVSAQLKSQAPDEVRRAADRLVRCGRLIAEHDDVHRVLRYRAARGALLSVPTVAEVRRAADRLVRCGRLIAEHDDVHRVLRYRAARGAPTIPVTTGSPLPRSRPVYTMVRRGRTAAGPIGGWHVYRNDPGESMTYVLARGLSEDEARACVCALNEMIESRTARSESRNRTTPQETTAAHSATPAIDQPKAEDARAWWVIDGEIERDKITFAAHELARLTYVALLSKEQAPGSHPFVYFSKETMSWWAVTIRAMIRLADMLNAKPPEEGRPSELEVIEAWDAINRHPDHGDAIELRERES
jgi:hypothetical protein